MAVRRTTRTRTLLLSAGALLLVAHASGWPPASRPPQAAADGVGRGALVLSVTVNKKSPRQAERVGIRVGHPVIKRYRLANRSGADLHRVTLTDPSVPPHALRCPRGQGFWMRGMSTVTCTARFSAAPGRHTATVRARGEVPSLGMRPTASVRAGYQGVTGALALAVSVHDTVAPRAVVRYTITNPGNRTVHGARLVDPALGRPPVDCGGRPGPPQALGPGAVVVCVARLSGLRPGTYRSAPEVRGSDRLFTLGPTCGRLVPPPVLVARASAPFVVRPRPAPPPPPPRAVPPPGGGGLVPPGGAGGGGGVGGGGAGGAGGGGAGGAGGAGAGGGAGAAGAAGAGAAAGTAAGAAPGAAAAGAAAGLLAAPGALGAPGAPGTAAAAAAAAAAAGGGAGAGAGALAGAAAPGAAAGPAGAAATAGGGLAPPGLAPGTGTGTGTGAGTGTGTGTGTGPGTGAGVGIPPGVGPRPPGRQSDRSRPADTPGRRGLTARADGAYRRDESVSPVVFLLLLFLPAAALVALASRRL